MKCSRENVIVQEIFHVVYHNIGQHKKVHPSWWLIFSLLALNLNLSDGQPSPLPEVNPQTPLPPPVHETEDDPAEVCKT